MSNNKKLSPRIWAAVILIGLVGQIAWVVENMYFNLFLYNTISTNPDYIAATVSWSAVAGTVTTMLVGFWSDRIGKRKIFVCGGYVIWGLSVASFALLTVENAAHLFPTANAVAVAAISVVVMDAVMTVFGSTANDAAFNAYVTDVTCTENRGRVEAVLTALPLIAMLLLFGLFDGMAQRGEWTAFFLFFGALMAGVGILSTFLIKDPPLTPRRDQDLRELAYGLRPSVVKQNPQLYLSFAAFAIFSTAVQIFFPYLIIYIQNYLMIQNYALVLGVVLILASIVSIAGGPMIDRMGKLTFVVPAAALMLAGLVAMYFVRETVPVMIAGFVMMSGYMLLSAALSANIRDWTPTDMVGHFQGIRMVFAVLIPMGIGPIIGAEVIKNSNRTYVELGVEKILPTPAIFLAAAITLLFVAVPLIFLRKEAKKNA